MKTQSAMIQGALALAGLGAVYFTWQKAPEKAPGDVVVLEASKNDLQLVRFEDDKGSVELSRRQGGEPSVWLKLSVKPQEPKAPDSKPADPKAADAKAATAKVADPKPPAVKVPDRDVRGNEASEKLLDSFAPLRATRALGVFEQNKLKEFGLAAPDAPDGGVAPPWKWRRIEVTVRGDKRAFTAGTPAGAYTTYLRDERDGRVYVLGGNTLSDLESASTRMVDRTVHTWKAAEFDGLTVEAGGKKRELVVVGAETPQPKIAPKKSPDKPDETAKNWHDKIFRVFPVEVLGTGETPAAGAPQVAVKITYTNKGADRGYLELGRVIVPAPAPLAAPAPTSLPPGATPPPPPPTPQPSTDYYARSEHTAGWVKIGSGMDDLVKEAEKIAAAE